MKKALVLLAMLSLATPACVMTVVQRDVGSVNADGSVYLGWHLMSRATASKPVDQETFDIGAQLGPFAAVRLHSDRPLSLAQVLVVFADGERWVAPAPPAMGAEEWSAPLPLARGPRPIHSIVVTGTSTSSLLAKLELHGYR